MKRKRYSENQIIQILKEGEGGMPAAEVGRKYGVSPQTVYRWKSKYGGLEVNELKRLKQVEEENRRLKKLVADQALDIQMLQEVTSKDW